MVNHFFSDVLQLDRLQYQANKLSKTIESYVSMKMYKIKLKDLESFTQ